MHSKNDSCKKGTVTYCHCAFLLFLFMLESLSKMQFLCQRFLFTLSLNYVDGPAKETLCATKKLKFFKKKRLTNPIECAIIKMYHMRHN